MDEVGRLVHEYRMLASVASKLDLLLDLVRIRDPHVVPFLLKVLGDPSEAETVRIHVLKRLRNGDGLVAPVERPQVAKAIRDVSADNSTTELRVEALSRWDCSPKSTECRPRSAPWPSRRRSQ